MANPRAERHVGLERAFDSFVAKNRYWPSGGAFSLRHTRDWILREIPQINPQSRVLDLGCGQAMPWRDVLTSTGAQWFGVDLHDSTADGYRQGDHKSIPFGDREFDVVVSMDVVEHFENPDAMFREVHRVLKSDGIWLGSCAFWQKEHSSFVHFTYRGLEAFLERNGFAVDYIEPSPASGVHLVFQRYWGGSGKLETSSFRTLTRSFILGAATAPLFYLVSTTEWLRKLAGTGDDRFAYCASLLFKATARIA